MNSKSFYIIRLTLVFLGIFSFSQEYEISTIKPLFSNSEEIETKLIDDQNDLVLGLRGLNTTGSLDVSSRFARSTKTKSSSHTNNKKPRGKFFLRESFIAGSIKVGSTLGSTQFFIQDTESTLFDDSEIFRTNFNFLRRTNTPEIVAEVEYMLLNSVGIGAFAGFRTSTRDNTNSDGITERTEIFGTVFGVYGIYYLPIENWLYFGPEFSFSLEAGNLNIADGLDSEEYDFTKFTVALDPEFTIAPSERVQFSLGLVSARYSASVFDGSVDKVDTITNPDGSTETTLIFEKQKIERNELSFGLAPSFGLLVTIFVQGGR